MWTDLLVGLAILVGLVGVVVPVLPGSLLVLGAIGVWAALAGSVSGWAVFAIAVGLIAAAGVAKYVWPGKRMVGSGVPRSSLVVGGVAGLVGFFVIPIVGLVIGFIAGTYATERRRLHEHRGAWRSTLEATKAAGLSILIELAGALAAASVWLGAVVVT